MFNINFDQNGLILNFKKFPEEGGYPRDGNTLS